MSERFFAELPNIIKAAAGSPLGMLALMIVVLGALGFVFFRQASERTRLLSFLLLFLGASVFGAAAIRTSESAPPDSVRDQPKAKVVRIARTFRVPKGEGGAPIDTGLTLLNNDKLTITGRGEIWSGVLLTKKNGPRGWFDALLKKDRKAKDNFPLPGKPPFALIGGYDNRNWFLVGDSVTVNYKGPKRELWLSINDHDTGRGKGTFEANVTITRAVLPSAPN